MREGDLQEVFDDWPASRNGWRIVGAPNWLLKCKGPNRRKRFTAKNATYQFRPDVLWYDPDCYVVELKRGAKYQPLALAEVLHHAWHLNDPGVWGSEFSKPPIPVIVATDTDWLRSALSYLFKHGLSHIALRYLEVAFYKTDSGGYLWFEEPFTERVPSDRIPDCIPNSWRASAITCYELAGCNSWILSDDKLCGQPAYIPARLVFVSSVPDSKDTLVCVYDAAAGQERSYLVSKVKKRGSLSGGAPACPFK
jgi:hypothetical protein